MRYVTNNSTDPFFNMAFDEWCLQNLPDEPVFCLWRNRPSVIIGITQNPQSEVNLEYLHEKGFDLVRRSTGGGAVYHDLQNLNYSFYGPAESMDSRIVDNMAEALRSLGAAAEVSGRNDIFVNGHKVSGYAKRVWKNRAIVHGTLMYDVNIDTLTHVLDTPESKLHRKGVASVRSRVGNLKELLPQFASVEELQDALRTHFAGSDQEMKLSAENLEEISSIRTSKYSAEDWIRGRF